MFFKKYYNLNKFLNNLKTFDEMFLNNIPDVFGKESVERGTDENGEWEKKVFTSEDGSFTYSFYTKRYTPTKETDYTSDLKTKLQEAIDTQDFETAVVLRDKIKDYENKESKIVDLEKELEESITSQNFERSIEIRDELNKIKTK